MDESLAAPLGVPRALTDRGQNEPAAGGIVYRSVFGHALRNEPGQRLLHVIMCHREAVLGSQPIVDAEDRTPGRGGDLAGEAQVRRGVAQVIAATVDKEDGLLGQAVIRTSAPFADAHGRDRVDGYALGERRLCGHRRIRHPAVVGIQFDEEGIAPEDALLLRVIARLQRMASRDKGLFRVVSSLCMSGLRNGVTLAPELDVSA